VLEKILPIQEHPAEYPPPPPPHAMQQQQQDQLLLSSRLTSSSHHLLYSTAHLLPHKVMKNFSSCFKGLRHKIVITGLYQNQLVFFAFLFTYH
jgi:hypothetical protein